MKRKKTTKQDAGSFAAPEIQQIEQLLQFMTEHNLEEIEYSRGDLRIRLRKPSAGDDAIVVAKRVCAGDYRCGSAVVPMQADAGGIRCSCGRIAIEVKIYT